MKTRFIYSLFLLAVLFYSCNNNSLQEEEIATKEKLVIDTAIAEIEALIQESQSYLENRDFDGDLIPDYLSFDYTGGAHCCYKVSLYISTLKDTIYYPFEMDGGYGFGIVDGSQHDQFDIEDYDQDGLPEIFMGISTYNGTLYAIDAEWTKEYGIKSNYILFNYTNGKLVLEDYDENKHLNK